MNGTRIGSLTTSPLLPSPLHHEVMHKLPQRCDDNNADGHQEAIPAASR
jgi:hypothetical protein